MAYVAGWADAAYVACAAGHAAGVAAVKHDGQFGAVAVLDWILSIREHIAPSTGDEHERIDAPQTPTRY